MEKEKKLKQPPADAAAPPGDEGEGTSKRKRKKARMEKVEAILPSQIKNKDKHRQVHAEVKREKKAQKRGQAARRGKELVEQPPERHVPWMIENTQESEESVTSYMELSPTEMKMIMTAGMKTIMTLLDEREEISRKEKDSLHRNVENRHSALNQQVDQVLQLAVELGVNATDTPEYFKAVMKLTLIPAHMCMFCCVDALGRMFILKRYSRDDQTSSGGALFSQNFSASRQADNNEDDDEFMAEMLADDDVFMTGMFRLLHANKQLSPSAVKMIMTRLDKLEELSREKKDLWHQAFGNRQNAQQVDQMLQLAAELGVNATDTPKYYMAITKITLYPAHMRMFISTDAAGRMFMLKQYSGVDN